MPEKTQRERKPVKLPANFNPDKHRQWLLDTVAKRDDMQGFMLENIVDGYAWFTRTRAVTEVQTADKRLDIALEGQPKPSDGQKWADRFAEQFAGYYMTRFEPFLGKAVLELLTDEEARCRGAIAVALGCKPWEVEVSTRKDGGFVARLPKTYMPSKHDTKLQEVATAVVGGEGWYVRTDPRSLVAELVPSVPPTFPPTIGYPMVKPERFDIGDERWAQIPLGHMLAEPGGTDGELLIADFVANPAMQVSGIMGSGKGVLLTNLIAGALERGWEVGMIDAVKACVDYVDIKPFLKPGFCGEDLAQAVAVLVMAYQEGERRKRLIKEHRVQKFSQLPPDLGVRPFMLVVDEATSLLQTEKVPQGIPKDSPIALQFAQRNLLKAVALDTLSKIPRELRFAGVSLVLATQVASATVGVPTELRANLPAKVLLGAKPTEGQRKLVFADIDAVPTVPGYLAADRAGAVKGAGVFDFAGRAPGVFKAFFTPPPQMGAWLSKLGLSMCEDPTPTAEQVARHTPSLEADEDDSSRGSGGRSRRVERAPSGKSAAQVRREMGDDDSWEFDEDGNRLSGYARANAARHQVSQTATKHATSGQDAASEY